MIGLDAVQPWQRRNVLLSTQSCSVMANLALVSDTSALVPSRAAVLFSAMPGLLGLAMPIAVRPFGYWIHGTTEAAATLQSAG